MKILVHICRLLVSATFLFSGFVKLVDPIGSSIKFKEYFAADVLNLEFLIPYSLPFAIILILIEIMLGLFLLIGYLPKFTVWGIFTVMLLFLFLTWYSAFYNKVTDCGCFGDAVKLSTWGTFYKNIVLITLSIFLIIGVNYILPIFKKPILKWVTFLSFLSFLYIVYYVLIHLPIIDFRPYAVGKNITKGMSYENNNEEPPIHDFFLEDEEGNDMTEKILLEEKVMLIVSYNLSKSDRKGFTLVGNIAKKAIHKGYTVYALSASLPEEFEIFRKEYQLPFNMLFCDETALKTMIRANPGIVILHKGTVFGKWNWTDSKNITFE